MANTATHATVAEPFILFELAGTLYALHSRDVQQMDMVEDITPVPNAPPFVEGVVFCRGEVIPAVNLRQRFGFEKQPYNLRTRLVVARQGERAVGLIVDSAREFVHIDVAGIKPPPEAINGLSGRYLEGIVRVGKRPVLVIDIAAALNFVDLAGVVAAPQA